MDADPKRIEREFVVLTPDQTATVELNDAELYHRLDGNYDAFRGHSLVSCHTFEADWGTWEIHPAGDETVVLLEGTATMVLFADGRESEVALEVAGQYYIVPANTWHTARVTGTCKLLFITPGEGTRHAEQPDLNTGEAVYAS